MPALTFPRTVPTQTESHPTTPAYPQVINYAIESGAFAHAFAIAEEGAPGRRAEVHLKYAMFLEDEGRFREAEQEFVIAGAHRRPPAGRPWPPCVSARLLSHQWRA